MIARFLKAETSGLFTAAELTFGKTNPENACLVKEDRAMYEVRPAKNKLK